MSWIISLTLLAAPVAVLAQDVATDLEGHVFTSNGAPLRSAEVRFEGPAEYISLTDSDGVFILGDARRGIYTVTVTQGNRFQRFTVNVGAALEPATLTVGW
jgi:hypothetical protein